MRAFKRLCDQAIVGLVLAASSCMPASSQAAPAAQARPAEALAFERLLLHPPAVGPETASTVAIFMTGDGGWASFDTKVCTDMSAAGVPTVGFDTSDYFSQMRAPEEAAKALGQAIKATLERYGAQHVIIAGYSFGADVAPFLFNRLDPAIRQRVDRLALMSPSKEAPFQVTLAERVGLEAPGARPVLPELERTAAEGGRILCLYGEHDKDTVCPSANIPRMQAIKLKGGHGLAGDHQAVARAILKD